MSCYMQPWLKPISTMLKKRAQAIGCDKGGLTTKIHTCSDALENLTGFYLTDSAAHDLCGSE